MSGYLAGFGGPDQASADRPGGSEIRIGSVNNADADKKTAPRAGAPTSPCFNSASSTMIWLRSGRMGSNLAAQAAAA
jgi:hypothetical protein